MTDSYQSYRNGAGCTTEEAFSMIEDAFKRFGADKVYFKISHIIHAPTAIWILPYLLILNANNGYRNDIARF